MEEKLSEILKLAYEISTTTKADVFFEYMPHVKYYYVRYFKNGWSENAEAEYVDFASEITSKNLDRTIKELSTIKTELEEEKCHQIG